MATAIISALTGHPHAQVGNGYAACTRTAMTFDCPPGVPVIRFLDTRGLGEIAYDGEDPIRAGAHYRDGLGLARTAGAVGTVELLTMRFEHR